MLQRLERDGIGRFTTFIAYRRGDTSGETVRLYGKLESLFGRQRIFMDIDTIPVGVDFVEYLANAVSSASVVICMIGPSWLSVQDENGRRRIESEYDFVRLELALALRSGVPVIPVLVNGASMPRRSQLPTDISQLADEAPCFLAHDTFEEDFTRIELRIRNLGDSRDHPNLSHGAHFDDQTHTGKEAPTANGGNVKDLIFMSYAREDETFSLRLYEDLKKYELPAWIDQMDINSGEPWEQSVEAALHKSNAFVVVLTKSSVQNDNVRDEIHFALSLKKLILPVLREECTKPLRLIRLQHIDFTRDYDGPMRKMVSDLHKAFH